MAGNKLVEGLSVIFGILFISSLVKGVNPFNRVPNLPCWAGVEIENGCIREGGK
jgi:hypothetical protein